jgi:hypothetical protein
MEEGYGNPNKYLRQLLKFYIDTGIPRYKQHKRNAFCKECEKDALARGGYSYPVGVFTVGQTYDKQRRKILFVGKNTNGWGPCNMTSDAENFMKYDIIRAIAQGHRREDGYFTRYWPVILMFARELLKTPEKPEVVFARIAITNLVKCGTGEPGGHPTAIMKNNCLNGLKVFENEVKILKPDVIILFVGSEYEDSVDRFGKFGDNKIGGGMCRYSSPGKNRFKAHMFHLNHPVRKSNAYLKEAIRFIKRKIF